MSLRLIIRDFVLDMSIGVAEHEHHKLQPVRVSIDLDLSDFVDPANDSLAGTVSYDDVVKGVRVLASAGHIELVETFASRIADICLHDARVTSAFVRVEKLGVYEGNPVPGVELRRSRT